MRRLLAISIVLAASPAIADPPPCEVKISRAPDEIRIAIESWLASETHCNVALDLRAVPTEGGFYLLARDRHGRVRERVVPDAQSAGVLVASWAADDELDGAAPRPVVDTAAADDAVAPMPVPLPPSLSPPPQVVNAPSLVDSVRPAEPPQQVSRRLGLYVLDGENTSGLRAEVDVWHRAAWSLGIAGSITQDELGNVSYLDTYSQSPGTASAQVRDIKVMAYAAHTTSFYDVLHARAAVGVGGIATTIELFEVTMGPVIGQPGSGTTVLPAFDASLTLGAMLGYGWSLEAGVLVDAFLPAHVAVPLSVDSNAVVSPDRGFQLSILGGLAHRL